MYLFRRKKPDRGLDTSLSRCLSTREVLVLAVGHMVGGGIYTLTGEIAQNVAGPGVLISYLIAGLAACLSALAYAEFGSRVPKAGSAYNYVYASLGEIFAFFVGWNIILEHIVGIAAVARTWSGYVDSLTNGSIHRTLQHCCWMGNYSSVLSPTPDLPAFFIVLTIGGLTALGAKISVTVSNVLTVVNLVMVTVISGATLSKANLKNWKPFAPFGVSGILAGASRCFFSYIGFDTVATAAEELRDPAKSIPRATLGSLVIASIIYTIMSAALTLALPYRSIDPVSAYASMWTGRDVWVKYLAITGAVVATSTGMAGHLFALPRCVFAMAEDGLLPGCLAVVWPVTKVPTLTILLLTAVAATLATFVELKTLVDLLAIGTLLAYGMVSLAVVCLRYEDVGRASTRQTKAVLAVVMGSILCVFTDKAFSDIFMNRTDWLFFVTAGLCYLSFLMALITFVAQIRRNPLDYPYQVPGFPYVPVASVMLNLVLLTHLPPITWARLAVWMAVGCWVYFGYSLRHSVEAKISAAKKHDG